MTEHDTTDSILRPINDRYGTYRGLIRLWLAHAELRARRLRRFTDIRLANVRRLVFVCRGNIWRSCFADARARALGLDAASFGLATSGSAPVSPLAVEVAAAFGIDLAGHHSMSVTDFVFREGDLVLAMEVRHARTVLRLVKQPQVQVSLLGLWARPPRPHIHDPDRLSAAYRHRCFSTIADSVTNLAIELHRR
jgi:protein-tyrosine phosphatase